MPKELAIVVDKNDKFLRHIERDRLGPNDCFRMVLVWIENPSGQVLLTRRSLSKKVFPGMWEPASAGGVIAGESYKQAAYRELKEEIGLSGIDLHFRKTTFLDLGKLGQRMIAWFYGQTTAKLQDLKLEQDAVMDAQFFDKAYILKKYLDNPSFYPPSAIFWEELFLTKE